MVDVRKLWLMVPSLLRNLPADLAAAAGLVAATWVVVLVPGVRETLLRALVGAPFVLLVPGYACTAALFPEAGESRPSDRETFFPRPGEGIGLFERLIFSFGLSVTTVPLLGLVLNFTTWGVTRQSMLVAVSAFTLVAVAVAAVRRRDLSPADRFRLPTRRWRESARAELLEPVSRADALLNVILVVSVLVAAGSVAYAVAGPDEDQSFTEFYVVTENETGALVAEDYPTEFRRGQSKSVVVGLSNHEHRPISYAVVVQLQRVRTAGNATEVLETRRLGAFSARVGAGETFRRTQELTPTMTGDRLRLQFLLYRQSPPSNPTIANAYRKVHFWINVTAPTDNA